MRKAQCTVNIILFYNSLFFMCKTFIHCQLVILNKLFCHGGKLHMTWWLDNLTKNELYLQLSISLILTSTTLRLLLWRQTHWFLNVCGKFWRSCQTDKSQPNTVRPGKSFIHTNYFGALMYLKNLSQTLFFNQILSGVYHIILPWSQLCIISFFVLSGLCDDWNPLGCTYL